MRVFTARTAQRHDPGPGHPERPERLATVLRALESAPQLELVEPPPALLEDLLVRHSRAYLQQVSRRGERHGNFGPDTPVGPHSWEAALAASGAALAALRHAHDGLGHSFAAIRPPGHHALPESGMGFCLVNHVAVLAAVARASGRARVLIVDWDVHHGNGTQAMVEHEPDTRFVSMHQWPWYPGTGAREERGVGNCFNIPLPPGLDRSTYVEALWAGITAATTGWTPDVVLLSAGYDAMLGDPLGGFTLEPPDYALWVNRLREALPKVPIVGLMEGGYAPERLAAGVMATIDALR
ncbi:MAG: histone deacetylase [Gemmatimonadota bacterium]